MSINYIKAQIIGNSPVGTAVTTLYYAPLAIPTTDISWIEAGKQRVIDHLSTNIVPAMALLVSSGLNYHTITAKAHNSAGISLPNFKVTESIDVDGNSSGGNATETQAFVAVFAFSLSIINSPDLPSLTLPIMDRSNVRIGPITTNYTGPTGNMLSNTVTTALQSLLATPILASGSEPAMAAIRVGSKLYDGTQFSTNSKAAGNIEECGLRPYAGILRSRLIKPSGI